MDSNKLILENISGEVSYYKTSIDNNFICMLTLEELNDIFEENRSDIFKYNTSGCLSLILDDNTEISLHEYKQQYKILFLKISNNALRTANNEILISMEDNHHIDEYYHFWQREMSLINTDESHNDIKYITNDLYGYENTQYILNQTAKYEDPKCKSDAAEHANSLTVKCHNTVYQGYLPSYGQMKIASDYISLINYILDYFNTLALPAKGYWTSNEYVWNRAISMELPGHLQYDTKRFGNSVLPFFKRLI